MRFFAAALIFFGVAASYAQTPEVPHKMDFAGMTLTIRDDARREIQTDVDALIRSPKHFNMKVERARTYFPFIEKVFIEEHLPDDFKYLALQESALIADAVSVSNAVGFWQFKDFTALEMGLRVDKDIDERMNLISASRGAARYLKKNNNFFNNWIYALQSYQMGAGGVQRSVGDQHNGARHMEITSETYWYVKKCLAHKIAFEPALKGEAQLKVMDYQPGSATSISDVSKLLSVDEAKLIEYNKWVRKGNIPNDRKYTLLVPIGNADDDFTKLALSKSVADQIEAPVNETKPVVVEKVLLINGIPTIKAEKGELLAALAKRANLEVSDFLQYNDLSIDHHVKGGATYFTEKKKTKAEEPFHQLQQGEDLWAVSQRYGVQLKKLRKYNRVNDQSKLVAGTPIWMASRMPKDANSNSMTPKPDSDAVELSEGELFEWHTVAPEAKSTLPVQSSEVPSELNRSLSLPVVSAEELNGVENTHTVRQGETLYAIAKNYSVNVSDLMQWNGLDPQKGIHPGQSLKVILKPAQAPITEQKIEIPQEEPASQFHEVKTSDTLYSVARQYAVTIKELMEWNSKTDFSLTVGEKLKVSSR